MKKVILIVLAVLLALGAIIIGAVFLFKANTNKTPDIRTTPIPQTLDISAAPTDTTVQGTPIATADATEKADEKTAMLFGTSYPAETFRSKEKYLTADGLTVALQRKTFYKNENGEVLYTALIEKDKMAVYDAGGTLLYYSGSEKVQADYTTEAIHWFYRDGKLACAELCFYDEDNTGAAYYDAAGNLLCVQTEIVSADKKDGVQIDNVYYDSNFTQIDEATFRALLPQIGVNEFLYVNWG